MINDIESWCYSKGLSPLRKEFGTLRLVKVGDLYKPDMLVVVYLGILKRVMDSLTQLLTNFGDFNNSAPSGIKCHLIEGSCALPRPTARFLSNRVRNYPTLVTFSFQLR